MQFRALNLPQLTRSFYSLQDGIGQERRQNLKEPDLLRQCQKAVEILLIQKAVVQNVKPENVSRFTPFVSLSDCYVVVSSKIKLSI